MIACINNTQSPMIEIHWRVMKTEGYSKAVIFARIMEVLQQCFNLNSLLVFRYETALRILYVKGCKHTVLSFPAVAIKSCCWLWIELLCCHQQVLFPVLLPLWLPAPNSAPNSNTLRSTQGCEPSTSQGRRKRRMILNWTEKIAKKTFRCSNCARHRLTKVEFFPLLVLHTLFSLDLILVFFTFIQQKTQVFFSSSFSIKTSCKLANINSLPEVDFLALKNQLKPVFVLKYLLKSRYGLFFTYGIFALKISFLIFTIYYLILCWQLSFLSWNIPYSLNILFASELQSTLPIKNNTSQLQSHFSFTYKSLLLCRLC